MNNGSSFTPSDQQVGKLCDRILSAVRKSGVNRKYFQDDLAYSGTELEDELVGVIVRFTKKVKGIITPVRAQDTGLIPNGYTVKSDNLEGDVKFANLDYSSCPFRKGDYYVDGDKMLERAGNAYGSLGFAAALLKAQEEGKEIFPVKSRRKHYFIMPRTVLSKIGGDNDIVAYFYWKGKKWALHYIWLKEHFKGDSRFVNDLTI